MITRRAFIGGAAATVAGSALVLPSAGCGTPFISDSFYRPTPSAPLTPQSLWYINAYSGTQTLDSASWSLRVEGNVGRPMTLDLAGLSRFRRRSLTMTMMCVGNIAGGGLISSGTFSGVRLADVLEQAKLLHATRALLLIGADGFPALLETHEALADDALLATHLNNAPLTPQHGFPLRLVRPGRYGFRQPKWLTGIRALRRAATVRLVNHSVNELVDPTIGVISRIDSPTVLASAGLVVVRGIALSGRAAITRVELSVDDGAFEPVGITFNRPDDGQPARLWSLWRTEVRLGRGEHQLRVRAFDALGRGQRDDFPFPYPSDSIQTLRLSVA